MNNTYNPLTDKILNKVIDEKLLVEVVDSYNVKILFPSGEELYIWVANYPYGYGRIDSISYLSNYRPSRRTIKRFHNYLTDQIEKDILNKLNF